jgi:hypothetical protein
MKVTALAAMSINRAYCKVRRMIFMALCSYFSAN